MTAYRLTFRQREALKRYTLMSEQEYMLDHYSQYSIHIDDDYCDYKSNLHNLTVAQLWFNNVALKYPHPCAKCKHDLLTYNRLVASQNTNQVAKFDTPKSKLRACSLRCCMWSGYFMARRVGFCQ